MRGLGWMCIGTSAMSRFAEHGRVRSAGRIQTRVPALALLAQSLGSDDVVAIEATMGTDQIVAVPTRAS